MNARSQHPTPLALEIASLGETERREMLALFERCYEGTSYARFASDLADKSRVLVLREGDELECLCELRADNLHPMARRAYLSGAAACVQP